MPYPRKKSAISSVIFSPGITTGTPGGHGQAVSAAILPTADARGSSSAGESSACRGVSGMGGSVTDLMNKKNAQKGTRGVKIDMTGAALTLDVYLTVAYGHPIPEVAENAQKAVASSVEAMTGCPVGTVNIHVDGVTLA